MGMNYWVHFYGDGRRYEMKMNLGEDEDRKATFNLKIYFIFIFYVCLLTDG